MNSGVSSESFTDNFVYTLNKNDDRFLNGVSSPLVPTSDKHSSSSSSSSNNNYNAYANKDIDFNRDFTDLLISPPTKRVDVLSQDIVKKYKQASNDTSRKRYQFNQVTASARRRSQHNDSTASTKKRRRQSIEVSKLLQGLDTISSTPIKMTDYSPIRQSHKKNYPTTTTTTNSNSARNDDDAFLLYFSKNQQASSSPLITPLKNSSKRSHSNQSYREVILALPSPSDISILNDIASEIRHRLKISNYDHHFSKQSVGRLSTTPKHVKSGSSVKKGLSVTPKAKDRSSSYSRSKNNTSNCMYDNIIDDFNNYSNIIKSSSTEMCMDSLIDNMCSYAPKTLSRSAEKALTPASILNTPRSNNIARAITPKASTPKCITPRAATPRSITPKANTPRAVTPKVITSKALTPRATTSKAKLLTPNASSYVDRLSTPKSIASKIVKSPAVSSRTTSGKKNGSKISASSLKKKMVVVNGKSFTPKSMYNSSFADGEVRQVLQNSHFKKYEHDEDGNDITVDCIDYNDITTNNNDEDDEDYASLMSSCASIIHRVDCAFDNIDLDSRNYEVVQQ